MPTQIEIEAPAGYAGKVDDRNKRTEVVFREFTSSDDGQHFIQRLEGWPSSVIERLGASTKPSQVDHLLAVFDAEGGATVYCNELDFLLKVRTTRDVSAGEAIYTDDIADIMALKLSVEVPDTASFLLVFSVGWRKGLFYDFDPTAGEGGVGPRPYNLPDMLGALYRQVMFQERYSITDAQWEAALAHKWFPFVGLGNELTLELLSRLQHGEDPDALVDRVVERVEGMAPSILEKWERDVRFSDHLPFIEKAVERFGASDYLSCTSLLYTRIEGVLRTWGKAVATTKTCASQSDLSEMAVAGSAGDQGSLLMPHRFETYLNDVYFADFDPDAKRMGMSRNTVGHGVAKAEDFNKKSSALGLLILDQLSYLFGRGAGEGGEPQ